MRWRLAIDTGGTFTDCLAAGPHGGARRVKVLSSSAVRARVLVRPDARTVTTRWDVAADVLAGCTLAPLDASDARPLAPTTIIGHGVHADGSSSLTLSQDVPLAALPPGAAFEVRTPWQPPILAARIATQTTAARGLPPIDMRLATTRGTNALLERRGHGPALFITAGFADLLEIGDQSRPDLFALDIVKPPPLHAGAYEVLERVGVDGSVLRPLDEAGLRGSARAALEAGHTTAAVALLHAWVNPAHERAAAAILREAGFTHVCASAELSPLIGFLGRAQSAVVNAYLSRVVGDYLAGVEQGLGPDGRLLVMTSAGGLSRAREFRPKDSLLSGPAGGLLGAADAAGDAGGPPLPRAGKVSTSLGEVDGGGEDAACFAASDRILTFDMGGTSTDVARCTSASRREFPLTREHRVGDARVLAPAVAVESVAAGGGSICAFDRGELRVGPESAGASPGPACYGAGGPLTITDCHLLLGRLDSGRFAIPIDEGAAGRAAHAVLERVNATSARLCLEDLLEGFLALADERMADAIRRISIRQGHDPAEHGLVAFGGAGGLHACSLARRLGMTRVIVPPDAGLLSARGLSVASIQRTAQRQTLRTLSDQQDWLRTALADLEGGAIAAVEAEGVPRQAITVARRQASARILGQSASFDLPADDPAALPRLFADAYQRTFGHAPPDRPIEIESLLVVAGAPPGGGADSAGRAALTDEALPHPTSNGLAPINLFADGRWHDATSIPRAALEAPASGPCIVTDAHSTTYVPPGWVASRAASGAVVLEHPGAPTAPTARPDTPAVAPSRSRDAEGRSAIPHLESQVQDLEPPSPASPIALELFIASLTAIAGDMGQMLQRTALSVNVKERLDFSCAILSPDGRLLVNAPHIPVHLGALGLCVRALARAVQMGPGDTIITNHPAYGGSHLPDVTLVTPIHTRTPGGPRLIGYAASRAHHAELGGIAPGSMPPGAMRLAEEGVVIAPMHLVRGGVERFAELARVLSSGRYPTRALEHNLADIRAALAANLHGSRALVELFARTGLDAAESQCGALTRRAESRVREALSRIRPGVYRHADALDDGSPIAVAVTVPEAFGDPQSVQSNPVQANPQGALEGGPGDGLGGVRPPSVVTIDFAGSAGVHPQNYNATPAIATAAVLYVLRLLAREAIPLNEGMLAAVELRLPTGSILDPGNAWTDADGPAVAAGNVETSQRVVDVLLLALGLAAASQGTMNNLAFGNEHFGFYETICGGAGATPLAPGASAVHTHMTNTRITDAEILEQRLPVLVRRFQIRRGSGGQGFYRGGDGVIREFEFLAPVTCSVLAQRRTSRPPGLGGGAPGRSGLEWVSKSTGESASVASPRLMIQIGDVLTIETPGGGGWGNPQIKPRRF